ncbi:MAG: hydroxymethylbilane synthase [Planctomycetes bacterium]|nr:hydroxymethylbilane synthase [Planctomycetota bacterium]
MTSPAEIVIGSRGSALAMTQTQGVADALRRQWPALSLRIQKISTQGDKIRDVPLAQVGVKGIFTREIDLALQRGEIHAAVHSLKDVPTELAEGIGIAAVPARESPNDAAITRDGRPFQDLPIASVVGTSSLRRQAQLLAWRHDLRITDLRGNVDTRLRKLEQGHLDAIILAAAGLHRLHIARTFELLPFSIMVPAPGQGALAIAARLDDVQTRALLEPLNHPDTRHAVQVERALLASLGGGCQLPFGTVATCPSPGMFSLTAVIALPDGSMMIRAEASSNDPNSLWMEVLDMFKQRGLKELLRKFR